MAVLGSFVPVLVLNPWPCSSFCGAAWWLLPLPTIAVPLSLAWVCGAPFGLSVRNRKSRFFPRAESRALHCPKVSHSLKQRLGGVGVMSEPSLSLPTCCRLCHSSQKCHLESHRMP